MWIPLYYNDDKCSQGKYPTKSIGQFMISLTKVKSSETPSCCIRYYLFGFTRRSCICHMSYCHYMCAVVLGCFCFVVYFYYRTFRFRTQQRWLRHLNKKILYSSLIKAIVLTVPRIKFKAWGVVVWQETSFVGTHNFPQLGLSWQTQPTCNSIRIFIYIYIYLSQLRSRMHLLYLQRICL